MAGNFHARADDADAAVCFQLGGDLSGARYRDADQRSRGSLKRNRARKSVASGDCRRRRRIGIAGALVQSDDGSTGGKPRRIDAGSAELRDKNLALEERRNYIETVLQSLTTGVVSLDEEDRVTTINAAAARMLRLNRLQLDNSLRLEQLLGAEDRVVLERLLRRARRTGHSTEQAQLTGAGT